MRETIKSAACLILLLFANFADVWADSPPQIIKICFLDLGDFSEKSGGQKLESAASLLSKTSADIFMLAGIADRTALNLIAKKLGMPHTELVEGADKERHLALISRIKPSKVICLTDLKYTLKDIELPVKRGFIDAVFEIDGYSFHLIGAHLQERVKVENLNQTDMRRYEGRLLRAHVNEIFRKEKNPNFLIAGNLNDTCGMSTIKEIYNRRFDIPKRLFDARPIDGMRTSWTYWNPDTDDYERIDYFLASSQLVPEIVRKDSFILENHEWRALSGHRPIVMGVLAREQSEWSRERFDAEYPSTIFEGEAKHFEADKGVGEKPQRNPPNSR